jgi:peptide chain release factor 2
MKLALQLYELERQKIEAVMGVLGLRRWEAWCGSQIRNYLLTPYRFMKDVRIGYEVRSPDAVWDGDIDGFTTECSIKSSQGQIAEVKRKRAGR